MPADELRYSVRHGARDVADEGGDLIASCCISRQCKLSSAFSYSGLKYFKFPCEPAMTVEQNVLQQHSQKVISHRLTWRLANFSPTAFVNSSWARGVCKDRDRAPVASSAPFDLLSRDYGTNIDRGEELFVNSK